LAIFWVILINFIFVCFLSVLVQTIVRFVISSLNQCSSCYKLYSCLCLFLVFFPICVMYSPREREQRRIVDQQCEKLSHGLGVLEREVDKCRRLFYNLQASWEKEVQRQKNERWRRVVVVIIQKYVRKWLVRHAYLKFLSVTTSIQCCWRKVLAIREFWRLKQKATEVANNPIQDLRVNLLEEGGNDTVHPCDTIQVRSDSDFGVKSVTVQVYGNSYNYQSDCWIGLNFYVDSPDMLSYYGLKFQVNRTSKRHRNTGQRRLYEFCYLLPFDLWTSYLVRILFLQGSGSWFWEFPSSTRIFNELQYNLQVWQGFINVLESFSYKDSLFTLAIQGKKS